MDSLTQIVLGAAIGELAQGKKLGNRAMIWGAIASTIPDLDVFVGKLYSNPVDELAFHRGISHSFFFAATFAYLMSVLTYWIYDKKLYEKSWFAYSLVGAMTAGIVAILIASGFSSIGLIGGGAVFAILLLYSIYRYRKTLSGNNFQSIDLGIKGWYKLFFWAIITHPILDCFTVYGTQIFLPFSNKRVSFDNISVADPGYTVPFLICLIIAAFFTRDSKYRSIYNKAGLVLSSIYMIWTFSNKHQVNNIVEQTLEEENISYKRYMTTPTILNNVLWSTTVESDSVYYQGQYSFFDEEKRFELIEIPKNRHLITDGEGDHTIETLKWFSNDYYNIMVRNDGRLQLNDLRYGSFSGEAKDENDFIFRFVVEQDRDGAYHMDESAGGPPRGREKEMLAKLWKRIQGTNNKDTHYENGGIATAHPLASKVGMDILKSGGNAFDAAVAVQFALAVVYPRAGNLGGGGFATIHTSNGISSTLDFRETAPAAAYREMYLDSNGDVIPKLSLQGAKASGVPGSVRGMLALHDSLGSIPLSDILTPAIELAKYGFPISQNEATRLNTYKQLFLEHNEHPTVFTKEGPWKAGDTLTNPPLSATLNRLASEGLNDFYTGDIADQIASHQHRTGGLITKADLEDYKAVWRAPISCDYKGYQVISMPPPSSGGIALCQILNAVEQLSIGDFEHNSVNYIHHLAEIEKRAFSIRNELIGDPDHIHIPVDKLLSEEFTSSLFSDIDSVASHQVVDQVMQKQIVKEVYETTHFSIVDKDKNTIGITTTLNGNFGSFSIIEGTGILMNNEMDDFTTKPGVANQYGLIGSENNSIAPRRRMLSSMSPTIVLREGEPFLVLGSPGGPTIITSVLQTLINIVEYNMDVQTAINATRFHDQGYPDGILIERTRLSAKVLSKLKDQGHEIRLANYIGAVEAILIDSLGFIHGGADHTRGKDDTFYGY